MTHKTVMSMMLVIFTITNGFKEVQIKQFLDVENRLWRTTEEIKLKTMFICDVERRLSELISARSTVIDRNDYLDNPLTSLVMVRRLAEDWTSLAALLGRVLGLSYLGVNGVRWPVEGDVIGAATAVLRCQQAYNLSTYLLAEGVVAGQSVSPSLSVADCFSMARTYYKLYHYAEATEWLQKALHKRTAAGAGDSSVSRQMVLYYLAAAICFSGNSKETRKTLLELLKDFRRANISDALEEDYKSMAENKCKELFAEYDWKRFAKVNRGFDDDYQEMTSRLCQGQGKVESGLRCRYVHYQQPHLRFQPFKLEELQLDPPILRFLDVVSDKESKILITEGKPRMERALTIKHTDGKIAKDLLLEARANHYHWLRPGGSMAMVALGDRLTRRIADMTQLDVSFSEYLQLARYGAGGEFRPHYDSYEGLKPFVEQRIATLMFYLNEVKQGGNTVFISRQLSVPPVKNSAILWFNFLPNGSLDWSSDHGGCPVLQGTKWVLNKWFLQSNNAFRFPCDLGRTGSFRKYFLV